MADPTRGAVVELLVDPALRPHASESAVDECASWSIESAASTEQRPVRLFVEADTLDGFVSVIECATTSRNPGAEQVRDKAFSRVTVTRTEALWLLQALPAALAYLAEVEGDGSPGVEEVDAAKRRMRRVATQVDRELEE